MAQKQSEPGLGTSGLDVAIVGAGFAGLYLLHKLRSLGFRARVYEAGSDIGGTWFWNRYPGARCDVESMQYSYSFDAALEQEWHWSERFATQPEILRYINHVADRFDLRRDVVLDTRIAAASFDPSLARWIIDTARGERIEATYCVMCTGCLSSSRLPAIEGLDSFTGRILQTAQWPHEPVDFAGKRVGVIGTGSSGIQAIPLIARQAEHLTVLQRTPNFSVPAHNWDMTEAYEQSWKDDYPALRKRARETTWSGTIYEFSDKAAFQVDEETRRREYEHRWQKGGANFMHAFNDLLLNDEANRTAADFVRGKIREIVGDPQTAAALLPHDHPLGAKRICVDTDYYDTYNRENVRLVDVRKAPIERITPTGLVAGGEAHALDVLVFATGFDALTGALTAVDIAGLGGRKLRDDWSDGPRSYLGLMVAGFPNLFTVTGPGSPSVLSNMIVSIEQHVDWIATCLGHLRSRGLDLIEAEPEAQRQWGEEVNAAAHRTLYPRANSWYMGANIPGKTRMFMPYVGGLGNYRRICAEIAEDGYRGFSCRASQIRDRLTA